MRNFEKASSRSLLAALALVATIVAADAQAKEPNINLPLPPCAPSAGSFIDRAKAITKWVSDAIGDSKDKRIMAKLRNVASRRKSPPAWTKRRGSWSDTGDYTVHFAVGRVPDYQNATTALTAAEDRAKQAAQAVAGDAEAYVLDWYLNDKGVAFALVGAIDPTKQETPTDGAQAGPEEVADEEPTEEPTTEPEEAPEEQPEETSEEKWIADEE